MASPPVNDLTGFGFPFITAHLRGWREPNPPIQGVAAIVERNGVRVYALASARESTAKSVILNLFEGHEKKPYRVKVRWPGWAGNRTNVFLPFPD